MMRARSIALAICACAAFGCERNSFDADSERAALLARDAEWATLASAKSDVEKIVSYWSDDAIVMPPGQPVVEGKAALREFVAASQKIPGFRIHWKSDHVSFSPDGQLAYMRSSNETTMTGPDGKPIVIPGRAITVWRKEAGTWRCVVDIWNEPARPGSGNN
jgi:ketosteroid isomerase-like protein